MSLLSCPATPLSPMLSFRPFASQRFTQVPICGQNVIPPTTFPKGVKLEPGELQSWLWTTLLQARASRHLQVNWPPQRGPETSRRAWEMGVSILLIGPILIYTPFVPFVVFFLCLLSFIVNPSRHSQRAGLISITPLLKDSNIVTRQNTTLLDIFSSQPVFQTQTNQTTCIQQPSQPCCLPLHPQPLQARPLSSTTVASPSTTRLLAKVRALGCKKSREATPSPTVAPMMAFPSSCLPPTTSRAQSLNSSLLHLARASSGTCPTSTATPSQRVV